MAPAAPARTATAAAGGREGGEDALQARLLDGVSRTFALTIPALPPGLRRPVANAYLLCRTLDTIEDEPALTFAQKREFSERFVGLVAGGEPAGEFSRELGERLSAGTLPAEHELVALLPEVLGVTRALAPNQRGPIARCVRVMADGMVAFQEAASPAGLADLRELDRYCYHVAGVVGELLTDLFAHYDPKVAERREELLVLAVGFGQGLQMTNILKDLWGDYQRSVCWLPRSAFEGSDVRLAEVAGCRDDPRFRTGLQRLVGVAKSHLDEALRYVLLLPRGEAGMRRFCLYALGMAVLTLRKIHRHPGFRDSDEVKISRRAVRWTVAAVNAAAGSNTLLRALYALASTGLPR